mmetsp:Transcript_165/g.289  ORF Transcript_165/g.289 Transcript_165/m.289 type:complete len:830 (+) Transcript_165:163-2652(+)|eukprot:CAMPEP_0185028000 /NCGR_PEP_ID=MMETSP1103-20130426/13397_1 /TAXON_ID=36769 /ORGANISM="Paraphysomonas bandaiensis, Strain Caron Lab Isolate" /LENGTH=829 /DNA_ID=CAMNT_0027562225 /DNA_START=106 /DNA_END=2595 /DNA_ORIENTATION=+
MSLDEVVGIYSDTSFDPEVAARIFFSDHSESEVSKKLNELANLQNQIEIVLRQKVRENYGLFMHANNEIHRVGVEMADLRHLLDITKKMLLEVRSLQPSADSRPLRSPEKRQINSGSPAKVERKQTAPYTQNVSDNIPAWVRGAPAEVDRLIVEQQYQQAVGIIKRTFVFLDSVKDIGLDDRPGEESIQDKMRRRSVHLAEVLRDSLSKLPNSELWGVAEQTKRLQLLVTLGHSDIAAQGFSTSRKDVIRKTLRYVEASGDAEAFTAELSRVFFMHLREACKSFIDLFAQNVTTPSQPVRPAGKYSNSAKHGAFFATEDFEAVAAESKLTTSAPGVDGEYSPRPQAQFDDEDDDGWGEISPAALETSRVGSMNANEKDMASLSYLIGWIQEQMAVFVTALARQIHMGAGEYMAKVFEQQVYILRDHHQRQLDFPQSRRESLTKGETSPSRSSKRFSRKSLSSSLEDGLLDTSPSSQPSKRRSVTRNSISQGMWSSSTRASISSPVNTVRGRLASISAGRDVPSYFTATVMGPLTFAARCLQVAYRESVVLDQLGLQGGASLGWHIVPEIKTIISNFADEIIREMEGEVARDDWAQVKCPQPEVKLPGKVGVVKSPEKKTEHSTPKKGGLSGLFGGVSVEDEGEALDAEESTIEVDAYTSASYDWVVALMTYFIGEVWSLLQVDTDSKRGDTGADMSPFQSKSLSSEVVDTHSVGAVLHRTDSLGTKSRDQPAYSRIDLCELDPEAVACLLRILVRYVRAMVSVDTSVFSFDQRDCFQQTVEEIKVSLLPSVEDVISRGFFSDGSTLVMNPPKTVFSTLRKNVDLLKRRG